MQWFKYSDAETPVEMIGITYWMIFLLAAPYPLLVYRRWRRRPRVGCCRACGYDLTGNVSGRCPECGIVGQNQGPG